jgi:hypothetical protein
MIAGRVHSMHHKLLVSLVHKMHPTPDDTINILLNWCDGSILPLWFDATINHLAAGRVHSMHHKLFGIDGA